MGDVDRDKGGLGRRRVLAAAGAGALTPLLAAAAATPANAQPANSADLQRDLQDQMHARQGVIQPVPTVDADWQQQVAAALGRPGKVMGGAVYRVGFPRRDLKVVSYGVAIKPGLALGSYVMFTRYVDRRTLLMGDLLRKRAASRHRRAAQPRVGADRDPQHLLAHSPGIWWPHFHGVSGDPVALARGLRAALDVTGTPPPSPAPQTPPVDLDTARIDAALGVKGTNDGGELQVHLRPPRDRRRPQPGPAASNGRDDRAELPAGRWRAGRDQRRLRDDAGEVQDILVALRRDQRGRAAQPRPDGPAAAVLHPFLGRRRRRHVGPWTSPGGAGHPGQACLTASRRWHSTLSR